MTATTLITFLAYLIIGTVPALTGHYLIRVAFMGGVWLAMLVGTIAAVIGGLVDTLFLTDLPDLLPVGGYLDILPPLVSAIVFTVLFGLISKSNRASR